MPCISHAPGLCQEETLTRPKGRYWDRSEVFLVFWFANSLLAFLALYSSCTSTLTHIPQLPPGTRRCAGIWTGLRRIFCANNTCGCLCPYLGAAAPSAGSGAPFCGLLSSLPRLKHSCTCLLFASWQIQGGRPEKR